MVSVRLVLAPVVVAAEAARLAAVVVAAVARPAWAVCPAAVRLSLAAVAVAVGVAVAARAPRVPLVVKAAPAVSDVSQRSSAGKNLTRCKHPPSVACASVKAMARPFVCAAALP